MYRGLKHQSSGVQKLRSRLLLNINCLYHTPEPYKNIVFHNSTHYL